MRKWFIIIGVLTIIALLLNLLDIALKEEAKLNTETRESSGTFFNTYHDSHLWIVLRGSPPRYFKHHPDCEGDHE